MHTTASNHVTIDEKGVARIDNTRWKVIHIAADKRYNGSTPEQMREQWPALTFAQIHAALAYYYDHQAEMDAQMDRNFEFAETMRREAPPSAVRERLKRDGFLP